MDILRSNSTKKSVSLSFVSTYVCWTLFKFAITYNFSSSLKKSSRFSLNVIQKNFIWCFDLNIIHFSKYGFVAFIMSQCIRMQQSYTSLTSEFIKNFIFIIFDIDLEKCSLATQNFDRSDWARNLGFWHSN